MKKLVRYSVYALTFALLLSGCGAGVDTGKGSSDKSSAEIESNSDNSPSSGTQVSEKSEEESSADSSEESKDISAAESSSESSEGSGSDDAGAGKITTEKADSGNTKLSSGSYDVRIGNKTVTLSGAYVVDGTDAVITGGEWSSSETDQNVFLVLNGGSLTLKNASITKTGDAGKNDSKRTSDVSDDYNFYGINSVILVVGENSKASIENCTVSSDCSGANAIFSLDSAVIDVNYAEINTTGNSSRGVYATNGGTINADHLSITTSGAHCAPVATDRGGGFVTVKNSKLVSSGDGSPNIYSTGEIVVENCIGTSTGSQAAVIEGKNSITMRNCSFTVSGKGNNGIMLYQSMSGDAADSDATASVSTLTMSDTTIDCQLDAPVFYITNTSSVINLNGGNTIKAKSGELVSAATGRWGRDGSNGGKLTMNISGESFNDTASADDISSISINLSNGAKFTGKTSGSVTIN